MCSRQDALTDDRRFYEAPAAPGARRSAPAVARNREPIAEVLQDWLPKHGVVLDVASGTGEHAIYFAERFPRLEWQPTDVHPDALGSIRAWTEHSGLTNVRLPLRLNASSPDWPIERADAVVNINMAHISPWEASLGLIDGAARLLPEGGRLILYGPWLKNDLETAPSNVAFDADLKRRDPRWGLRRVEDFASAAERKGFEFSEWRRMPANNVMLLFRATKGDHT
jgi:SAM-dependent methyltransferase